MRRQLNLYDLVRIPEKKRVIEYYHPCLLRGRGDLLGQIRCERVKTGKRGAETSEETMIPDFDAMGPISPPPPH